MSENRLLISVDNHAPLDMPYRQDPEIIRQSILRLVETLRPRRVTAFAIGHDGQAQYPSSVLPCVPGMDFDLVQMWKDIVAPAGIEFFIYVSSLRNDIIRRQKPAYARRFSNASEAQVLDHNSAYVEEVLFPSLQEIIDRYDPDGFFFDGDFWTLHDSWHPDTLRKFKVWTKHGKTPVDFSDPVFPEFRAHTYASYDGYVEKMSSFFAKQKRRINWTINNAFSFRDPSPVPVGVRRTTVDMPPFFGLVESYLEAHFAQLRSQEFDINFPRFVHPEGSNRLQGKSLVQLSQELAVAHAASSLTHFYLPMRESGAISSEELQPLADAMKRFGDVYGDPPGFRGYTLAEGPAILHSNAHARATRDMTPIRGASMALFMGGINHRILSDAQLMDATPDAVLIVDTIAHEAATLERIRALLDQGVPVVVTETSFRADRALATLISKASTSHPGQIFTLPGSPFIDFNSALDEASLTLLYDLLRDRDRTPLQVSIKPREVFVKTYMSSDGRPDAFLCLSNLSFGGPALSRHCHYGSVPKARSATFNSRRKLLSVVQVTDDGIHNLKIVSDGGAFQTQPFEIYSTVQVVFADVR